MFRLLFLLSVIVSGAAAAADSIVLQLKWRHQFQFAGYYAALEKGFYRDAGLDVTLVEASPGTDVVEEVASGRAQFGVGTSDLLLAHRRYPVVALAVIFQHSPLILLAREDRAGNLHQLAGQTVMVEPHAEELFAYLRYERLPPEKLKLLPHGQSVDALVAGQVAAMTAYATTEPFLLDRAGVKTVEFSPRSGGIDFYGDNLFTSEKELRRNPERVRAFRAASLRGWEYAMRHPGEIIDLILKRYNTQKLDREFLQFEADRTASLMQSDLVEIGYMNRGRWQHIADTYAGLEMKARGELPEGFLYEDGARPIPAWIFPIGLSVFLLMAGLSLLAARNAKLSRRLREEVAAQEAANRRLAESEEKYRFMLENSADTFWMLDRNMCFTYISESDKSVRGFDASEVVGRSLFSMMTPASLEEVRRKMAQRQELEQAGQVTGPMRFEVEMYRKDGTTLWVEAHSTPCRDADGAIVGFQGITRDITEQRRYQNELQAANLKLAELSATDALTGLANRRRFNEQLMTEWSRARRNRRPLALLMVDVDHFKKYNDRYGHQAGDECLIEVARALRDSARRAGDYPARYGGEEFVLLIAELELDQAQELAEIACRAVEGLALPHEASPYGKVTISIGVASLVPEGSVRAEDLVRIADKALYLAKEKGRNRAEAIASLAALREEGLPEGFGAGFIRLQWHPAYDCGQPDIDEQHRELLQLTNEVVEHAIADPRSGRFRQAFDMLHQRLAAHFAHEEARLREQGGADLEAHAQQHRELLERAADFAKRIDKSGVTPGELIDFLIDEAIVQHMTHSDFNFYRAGESAPGPLGAVEGGREG